MNFFVFFVESKRLTVTFDRRLFDLGIVYWGHFFFFFEKIYFFGEILVGILYKLNEKSEKVLFFATSCAIIFYTHIIIYNFPRIRRAKDSVFEMLGGRFLIDL